ncbi:MAG TPA: MBL fold metallo-hydrolase [Acidimicrobiia bacterium]
MTDYADLGHGIHRITLPLPIPQLRSVNCYLFEGPGGVTVLDCGANTTEGHEILVQGLGHAGFGITEVDRLIGTHLHPDHIGLSQRFVRETEAEFVLHSRAAAAIPLYNDWTIRFRQLAAWFRPHGAPASMVEELEADDVRPDWAGEADPPSTTVEDGAKIPLGPDRWLEVVYTPGHEVNHICVIDSRTGLLFSGDHVLPRITPFVPYVEGTDTLGQYLESLERIELLDPGVTHPAHGTVIDRGRARARQITLHHERRLGAMLHELRTGPKTAWQVMEAVFRPNLMGFEQRLAIQETLAHLEYLRGQGQASRFWEDDLWWYRR